MSPSFYGLFQALGWLTLAGAFVLRPPPPKSTLRVVCSADPNAAEKCVAVGREPITEDMLIDGDVIDTPTLRNAIIDPKRRWPGGVVPYVYHRSFTEDDKRKIRHALDKIEEKTCVKFVPWDGKGVYALVTNEPGCHSHLGYSPNSKGYARVNIHDKGCLNKMGTIQHEFFHLLGLKHEHSRPDRDTYIRVIWDNIRKGHEKNFNKADPRQFTTFGLPYDYKSIMHYTRFEFSKNRKATLEAKIDKEMELGQRVEATELDLQKIRKMYCERQDEETKTESSEYYQYR